MIPGWGEEGAPVLERPAGEPVVAVAAVGAAEGARGAAYALACAGAGPDRATLLVEFGGRPPRPTLLASAAARELEERLTAHLPHARAAARGQVCHLGAPADEQGLAAAAAAVAVNRGAGSTLALPRGFLQELLAAGRPAIGGVLLRADVVADRALLALAYEDLVGRGLGVGVLKRRLGWVEERRASFGVLGEEGIPDRLRVRVNRPPVRVPAQIGL